MKMGVENFHRKKCFRKIYFVNVFQIDITSSDLNEFWIGQKFWKAEKLLLHLSTTFTGLRPI